MSFRGAKPIGLVCDIGISGFSASLLTEIATVQIAPIGAGPRNDDANSTRPTTQKYFNPIIILVFLGELGALALRDPQGPEQSRSGGENAGFLKLFIRILRPEWGSAERLCKRAKDRKLSQPERKNRKLEQLN